MAASRRGRAVTALGAAALEDRAGRSATAGAGVERATNCLGSHGKHSHLLSSCLRTAAVVSSPPRDGGVNVRGSNGSNTLGNIVHCGVQRRRFGWRPPPLAQAILVASPPLAQAIRVASRPMAHRRRLRSSRCRLTSRLMSGNGRSLRVRGQRIGFLPCTSSARNTKARSRPR